MVLKYLILSRHKDLILLGHMLCMKLVRKKKKVK